MVSSYLQFFISKRIDFSNENLLKDELEKGNHNALIFLMETYQKPLCTYIYNLSRDYELAQDVVQEVFIKIWEDKDKIQSVSFVNRYLYKSVYYGFLNKLRKDKRMISIKEEHMQTFDEIIEDDDELQNQMKLISLEVQKLPQRCKETFTLSKNEGLNNTEIANYMNVSSRTVEAQMNKAFSILRENLNLKDKKTTAIYLP